MTAPVRDDREHARRLVLAHGWNATSYQILNPGIELWFAPGGDGVVGYVRQGRMRVVAGAPVCAGERLPAVAAAFEHDASCRGERVCYFAAESRLGAVARAQPYGALLIGAQPVWRPQQLARTIRARASLRAQLHRAGNKGVRAVEWAAERAVGDDGLRCCLAHWQRTRGLPALHFLVESQTLDALLDRRVFVAERHGEPVAFLVATPIPARSGWLVEQLVRGAGACNGTAEVLLAAAADAASAAGVGLITLGLAPLARPAGIGPGPAPLAVRALLAWLRAHARRFYDFRGLEAFKTKFRPERWEPVFALSTSPRVTVATLYWIGRAFAQGSLAWLVARGLGRAVRCELASLRSRSRARG